jgi:hypothetical protein
MSPAVKLDRPWFDATNLQDVRLAPWIEGETCPDRFLGGGIDDQEYFRARAERAAKNDKLLGRERGHERSMLVPEGLGTHRQSRIPGGPVNASNGEVRRVAHGQFRRGMRDSRQSIAAIPAATTNAIPLTQTGTIMPLIVTSHPWTKRINCRTAINERKIVASVVNGFMSNSLVAGGIVRPYPLAIQTSSGMPLVPGSVRQLFAMRLTPQ